MDQHTLRVMRDALAAEQARVLATVGDISGADWEVQLPVAATRELVAVGHFKQYETELGWTPRQVVGHLRDSAQIFSGRIQALQVGGRPLLADFVTDAPMRLADYAAHTPEGLRAGLAASQQQLREVLATVVVAQMSNPGIHEVDGTLTLAEVVAFLPGHQRDHAEQLVRLLATAGSPTRAEVGAGRRARHPYSLEARPRTVRLKQGRASDLSVVEASIRP